MFPDILNRYGINPKSYLDIAKIIAQKENYDPSLLTFSSNPKKKLSYAGRDFGASDYMDYILYSIMQPHLAEKKRNSYRKRARQTAIDTGDKYSPANLAYHILW